MKILTWNLNNRAKNQKAWDVILDYDPDLALISEANFIPTDLSGFSICSEAAMGSHRRSRRFRTCILAKGQIREPIQLVAKQDWVNEGLRAFPGNFVARRIDFPVWGVVNAISVHMPSWYFPHRQFTNDDLSDVILPGYSKISMSELLWAALAETMPCLDGDWIVGGDFNTSEFLGSTKLQNDANREVIDRMRRLGFVEAVRHLNGRPVPSWKSSRKTAALKHQLDHLYLSGAFREFLASASIGAPGLYFPLGLTDHLPLMAEIGCPNQCLLEKSISNSRELSERMV
jgi:exodeoxyribonuclease-3